MRTRIIDREAATEVDRWSYPSVDDSAAAALEGARSGAAHLLTARQLDELQREAHREAYERGFAEGLEAGRAELASRATRLASLVEGLARPFEDLDVTVTEELAALAVALASHLLRRELAVDSEPLAAAIKDAIAALPSAARDLTLHLNPDDAALLREHQPAEARFRVETDASLERGDLRLTASSSEVDGRLETRLGRLVAAALADLELGGDRA